MRKILFAAAAVAALSASLPLDAFAQARPATPRMSCAAAARLVQRAGAIVLTTGPNTYDRFVKDRRFCQTTEVTKPEWVRTADDPQCFIGYSCHESDREDFIPFWR